MGDRTQQQTILIVDDVPANIKILGASLNPNYKIRLATDGRKALKIASSNPLPDLILLDIVMPDMNGYEVCTILKSDDRTKNIPIIFITSKDNEEDETRGLELGAVDYIIKPFIPAIVEARVKTHLELKRHRDMLESLSTLDGLTGIHNRRSFEERVNHEWKRAVRDRNIMSLIMIDIDNFKSFNDTYGHLEGDDILRMVSRSLASCIRRPADYIARYGGEEFVCILPNTDMPGSYHVAEQMRMAVESLGIPHVASPVSKYVTASLGTASVSPTVNLEPVLLLDAADKCLYQAKNQNKNCVKSVNLDLNDNAG